MAAILSLSFMPKKKKTIFAKTVCINYNKFIQIA